jgi:hypothetical protein
MLYSCAYACNAAKREVCCGEKCNTEVYSRLVRITVLLLCCTQATVNMALSTLKEDAERPRNTICYIMVSQLQNPQTKVRGVQGKGLIAAAWITQLINFPIAFLLSYAGLFDGQHATVTSRSVLNACMYI